ncbi:hypothetical protein H4S07_004732, partial [Coemansia furcata]
MLPSTVVAQTQFWAKMAIAIMVFVASAAELLVLAQLYPYVNVFTVSMALQSAAAVLAIRLHWCEQFTNRVASTTLLLFWLATVLLALMRLRTAIALDVSSGPVTACSVFLLLSLAALVMESQAKPHMLYELDDEDEDYYPGTLEDTSR